MLEVTLERSGVCHSQEQGKRVFERTVCANMQRCKTQEILLYSETTRTQVLGKRKYKRQKTKQTPAWGQLAKALVFLAEKLEHDSTGQDLREEIHPWRICL